MPQREITVLTDAALITCIVQKGAADAIVRASRAAGAQGATVYYAKGSGVRERLGVLGVAVEVEKEVISIVVAADQVDAITEVMYDAGRLDTPGMGFLYVTPLEMAATYVPPDVLERIRQRTSGRADRA